MSPESHWCVGTREESSGVCAPGCPHSGLSGMEKEPSSWWNWKGCSTTLVAVSASMRHHGGAASPSPGMRARTEVDKAETPVQIPPECRNQSPPFWTTWRGEKPWEENRGVLPDMKRLSYSLEKIEAMGPTLCILWLESGHIRYSTKIIEYFP